MMQENIQWPKLALYLTNNTEAEETRTDIARQGAHRKNWRRCP